MRLWIDDERPMPAPFDFHARGYDAAVEALSTREVARAVMRGLDRFFAEKGNRDGREQKTGDAVQPS